MKVEQQTTRFMPTTGKALAIYTARGKPRSYVEILSTAIARPLPIKQHLAPIISQDYDGVW